jgi:hypothetical protein
MNNYELWNKNFEIPTQIFKCKVSSTLIDIQENQRQR